MDFYHGSKNIPTKSVNCSNTQISRTNKSRNAELNGFPNTQKWRKQNPFDLCFKTDTKSVKCFEIKIEPMNTQINNWSRNANLMVFLIPGMSETKSIRPLLFKTFWNNNRKLNLDMNEKSLPGYKCRRDSDYKFHICLSL